MHFPRLLSTADHDPKPGDLRPPHVAPGRLGPRGLAAVLVGIAIATSGGCSDGDGVSFTDTPIQSGGGGSGAQASAGGSSSTASGGSLSSAGSAAGVAGDFFSEAGGPTGEGGAAGNTEAGGSGGKTQGGSGGSAGGAGGLEAGGSAGHSGAAGTSGTSGTGAGGGGSAGTSAGGAGGSTPCVPSPEICDGLDNDCDGHADESSVCPTNCTGATFAGHVYYFCRAQVAHATATQRCNGFGLRLVSIESSAENDFVEQNAAATTWLGASDEPEGTWRWPDGTQFWRGAANGAAYMDRFAHWVSGQPDDQGTLGIRENCAVMVVSGTSSGLWKDVACLLPDYRYTCESYEPGSEDDPPPEPDPGPQPGPGPGNQGSQGNQGNQGNPPGGPDR